MSDSQINVQGQEAIKTIKELVSHVRTCVMMTALSKRPISTYPMGIQKVDEKGRIFFLSDKDSDKNREITLSNEMQLTISNDSDSEYLSIYGTAEVYRNQTEIDEMYNALANNWFDGKEDPKVTIIRFTPKEGYYWDTKHGKMIQFAGMLVGAITGKPASDGKEGKISV